MEKLISDGFMPRSVLGHGKGKLFVLEGIDGSGKTTQAKLLFESGVFKEGKVVLTKEPTGWIAGSFLKKSMKSRDMVDPMTTQLLFIADRSHHTATEIMPALERGDNVVCDRYALSTIAYGTASGLSREWLEELNKPFLELITLGILIDVDPETAIGRIEQRRKSKTYFENLKELETVRRSYMEIVHLYSNFVIVDGSKSIKEVHESIRSAVAYALHV